MSINSASYIPSPVCCSKKTHVHVCEFLPQSNKAGPDVQDLNFNANVFGK